MFKVFLCVLVLTVAVVSDAIAVEVRQSVSSAIRGAATASSKEELLHGFYTAAVEAAKDPVVYLALKEALANGKHGRPALLETNQQSRVSGGGDKCRQNGFVDVFIPECKNCNGDGCSFFSCSINTEWNCPAGFEGCDSDTCVSNFCSPRRYCGRKP
jgi:hypothetical protein